MSTLRSSPKKLFTLIVQRTIEYYYKLSPRNLKSLFKEPKNGEPAHDMYPLRYEIKPEIILYFRIFSRIPVSDDNWAVYCDVYKSNSDVYKSNTYSPPQIDYLYCRFHLSILFRQTNLIMLKFAFHLAQNASDSKDCD